MFFRTKRIGRTVRVMPDGQPTPEDRDKRVSLPLDPETALRALLRVDPDAPAADEDDGEEPRPSEPR